MRSTTRASVATGPRCGSCSIAGLAGGSSPSRASTHRAAARVMAASGLPAAGYDPFRIVGVAPDDSLVAVDASGLVLVEPVTGRVNRRSTGGSWPSSHRPPRTRGPGEPFRPDEPSRPSSPFFPPTRPCPPSPTWSPTSSLAATASSGARSTSPSRVRPGRRRRRRSDRSTSRWGLASCSPAAVHRRCW